ncbi:hypothetical protein B0H13DRAFT_2689713 [Mycena leptocephala]|nr:hypothetical protein B0H13DRAFT_2689713 [Mycena leptocephala]
MLSSFITFAVLVCLCATPTQAAAAFRPGTCCFSGVCNMAIPWVMNPVPSRPSPRTLLAAALWGMVLLDPAISIVTLWCNGVSVYYVARLPGEDRVAGELDTL